MKVRTFKWKWEGPGSRHFHRKHLYHHMKPAQQGLTLSSIKIKQPTLSQATIELKV
jgi:hypothetical protein